eukprot:TRINITY_DN7668_c0_g3_i1.p1 TRINITY_DN7668_c0_g3~~TRINITY_DN7668_c0_g3_i1.p1  ORF type:complete len:105 (+),score=20.59 TRINITY_DN7668_c0_g3_i1:113-427(+)
MYIAFLRVSLKCQLAVAEDRKGREGVEKKMFTADCLAFLGDKVTLQKRLIKLVSNSNSVREYSLLSLRSREENDEETGCLCIANSQQFLVLTLMNLTKRDTKQL